MIPVVTTDEMRRIERWAVDRGASEEALMQEAGKQVAAAAKDLFSGKKVLLLIGKGNKGGDAYVAGRELLKAGYDVRAYLAYPIEMCSPLNQKFGQQFPQSDDFDCDFIIDGLLGTGFRGAISDPLSRIMDEANQSKKPILAIDIPSGLDGSTGDTSPYTLNATVTVTLGLPKIGLFLKNGWNCVGKLCIRDIGLPEEAIAEAKPVAWIPKLEELHLPPQMRNQHKYSRGFVLGFGGSFAMKGAVKLAGLSALHAGAGIVKIFSLEEIGEAPPELICQIFDPKPWKEALAKASAAFIGPGLGRTPAVKQWLENHSIDCPCVIDADALFFLTDFPKHSSILTPHAGEMAHLLKQTGCATTEEFVETKQVIVVLKGAPTMILAPGHLPVIIPRGDPGMATAGSGDVLTGILAALLAQGMSLFAAAVLGVSLHALAGEACAKEKTSYGYSASDLIGALPQALKLFL